MFPSKRNLQFVVVVLTVSIWSFASGAALKVPGPYGRVVDVTAKTGREVVGQVTSWQVVSGAYNVEHLAGRSPADELLVFYWSPRADWQYINVTQKTRYRVRSPVVAWQTPNGNETVEHLAGVSPDERLITFWWSPSADWRAVDVTAKTGVNVTGELTAWQTKSGRYNVEHLAGRNARGELFVFWWSPAADWQAVNVTAKTGVAVLGAVTSWQTEINGENIEHLAGISLDGKPVEFTWGGGSDWAAMEIPSNAGPMKSALSFWLAGPIETLAGPNADGDLIVYQRPVGGSWQGVDVTWLTGEKVVARPTPYQVPDGSGFIEILGAQSPSGDLLHFWYTEALDWQVYSVSEVSSFEIAFPPEGWVTPGPSGVEHFAAPTLGRHLLVFLDNQKPRLLTDDLQRPFQTLSRQRGVVRNTVTILWAPEDPGTIHPGRFPVANATAVLARVNDYYKENSGEHYGVNNVATLGWYASQKSADHYWLPHANNAQNDGWLVGDVEKWAEAIRQADADFDFQQFDADMDGVLEARELAVVIMIPRPAGDWGFARAVVGLQFPVSQPLVVDAVTIPYIVEIYTGGMVPNLGLIAHELAHRILDHVDMYFDATSFFNPYKSGWHAIMDGDQRGAHHDPFTKIKLGWARPRIVLRYGRYELPAVESSRMVRVLLHPERYADEYLLLENRFRGSSFDSVLPNDGLAVWHIIEDPTLYQNIAAPPNAPVGCMAPTQCWDTLPITDWGRRAIRLIRPNVLPPYQDAESLWDGAVPPRSYKLTSVDADPAHATLRWADGVAGHWSLQDFSDTGPIMEVSIVP